MTVGGWEWEGCGTLTASFLDAHSPGGLSCKKNFVCAHVQPPVAGPFDVALRFLCNLAEQFWVLFCCRRYCIRTPLSRVVITP